VNKTVFRVSKMDCPSEEGLIKMKLSGFREIHSLHFDLQGRMLTICHSGDHSVIADTLHNLDLGTSFISTELVEEAPVQAININEKKLLWQVLFINFFFFVLEIFAGVLAGSMGLVADGLDMLADSIVYGLALMAVGGSVVRKNRVATVSGYFQIILAILGFIEVIRRFIGYEEMPGFRVMIVISLLALCGNALSLYLLRKSKSTDSHMRASMIFTSNDIIINIGVISAGVLVYLLNSRIPDLLIGAVVFVIVGRGALRILKLAK
jgi:Co/Zn/Cd efflux system component